MSDDNGCFNCGGPTHSHDVCPYRPTDPGCCCCADSQPMPLRPRRRATLVKVRSHWEVIECQDSTIIARFDAEGEALDYMEANRIDVCRVSAAMCKAQIKRQEVTG